MPRLCRSIHGKAYEVWVSPGRLSLYSMLHQKVTSPYIVSWLLKWQGTKFSWLYNLEKNSSHKGVQLFACLNQKLSDLGHYKWTLKWNSPIQRMHVFNDVQYCGSGLQLSCLQTAWLSLSLHCKLKLYCLFTVKILTRPDCLKVNTLSMRSPLPEICVLNLYERCHIKISPQSIFLSFIP